MYTDYINGEERCRVIGRKLIYWVSALCITGGTVDATGAMDVVRAKAMTSSLMSSTAMPPKASDRAVHKTREQNAETAAPSRRVRTASANSSFEAALLKAFEGLDPVLPAPVTPEAAKVSEPAQPAAAPALKPVETVKPVEPAKPIEESKPIAAEIPAEATKPIEVMRPIEVVTPVEAAKPIVRPAEIAKPSEVVSPVELAKPVAEAFKPAETPAPVEAVAPPAATYSLALAKPDDIPTTEIGETEIPSAPYEGKKKPVASQPQPVVSAPAGKVPGTANPVAAASVVLPQIA